MTCLKSMFPNLNILATISLSFLSLATTSVERSFSHIKLIKTQLRRSLSESSLSHLKIAIETEDKLTDSDLEAIVDIWDKKEE